MYYPQMLTFGADVNDIGLLTLNDDSILESTQVAFEPATYLFRDVSTGEDITNLISRADKLKLVNNFDVNKENERMYQWHYAQTHGGKAPPPVDNRSFTSIFLAGVNKDITDAGSNVGKGVKDTVQTAVIFGIAGLVIYMLMKPKI